MDKVMNNEQRRELLETARRNAYEWALTAEKASETGYAPESQEGLEAIAMANMWAAVADALKVGDAHADGP